MSVFDIQGIAEWESSPGGFALSGSGIARLVPGGAPAILGLFDNAVADGANYIRLTDSYGIDPDSGVISDTSETGTFSDLGPAIAAAQSRGLNVFLEPVVTSSAAPLTLTTTVIANPAAFFASYKALVLSYAQLAQQYHISLLSIGAEMGAATEPQYTSYWDDIIDSVRQVYSGKLTYGALTEGNEENQIQFWNKLDYVGLDAYPGLAVGDDPTVAQLNTAWVQPGRTALGTATPSAYQQISNIANQTGKPVLFVETGVGSFTGAAGPLAGGGFPSGVTSDFQEQSNWWQSFFDTWAISKPSWLAGIIAFGNGTSVSSPLAPTWYTNFAINGKPAETVISQSFHSSVSAPLPIANADAYITARNTSLTVDASSGVLANDGGMAGGALVATLWGPPMNGSVTLNADGSFTYVPTSGFIGNDSFTYQANSGGLASIPTTVNIVVGNIGALTTPAQLITEFYAGYYNRAPDPAGLAYWINLYNTPPVQSADGINPFYHNIAQVAASFADPGQTETVALYPFLKDPSAGTYNDIVTFVTNAYGNLFGRQVTGTDTGVQYWATSVAKSLGIVVPKFGNPTVDNTAPVSASNALIALILGAQGNDGVTIADKVVVGGYYVSELNSSGTAFTMASGQAAFSGVTSASSTVLASETAITAFAYPSTAATELAALPASATITRTPAENVTASATTGLNAPALTFIGTPDIVTLGDAATTLQFALTSVSGIETIADFQYGLDQLNIELAGAPNSVFEAFDTAVNGSHAVAIASSADLAHGVVLLNLPTADTAANLLANHVIFSGGSAIVS